MEKIIIGIAMIVCFVFCSAATNDGAEFASNRFMVQQQQKQFGIQIKFSNYKFMRTPNSIFAAEIDLTAEMTMHRMTF